MPNKRILIIDDEPTVRDFLQEALKRKKIQVRLASSGREALNELKNDKFNLVISDIRLPDLNGMELLKKNKKIKNGPGVIMITGYSTVKSAVEAMKIGAYDYIAKPITLDVMELVVERYFRYLQLVKENRYWRSESNKDYDFKKNIGKSSKMQQIFDTIKIVAQSKATVLIQAKAVPERN